MKRFIVNGSFVVVLGLVLMVTGCASHYYKVTDPQSGSVYYTQEIDNLTGGAVKLKDARSGSSITLQNSAVKEISKDEFNVGAFAPAPAAAPAVAPAVAAPAAAPVAAPSSAQTGT